MEISNPVSLLKSNLSQKVFQHSHWKAWGGLLVTIMLLTASYVGLYQLPAWYLPLGWLVTGLIGTRLYRISHACSLNSFFRNHALNHVVGQVLMMPLATPFEAWKLQYKDWMESNCKQLRSSWEGHMNVLARSHFWWLTSFWQTITPNISLFTEPSRVVSQKRIVANLVCTYLFLGVVFPLVTYNVGIWMLTKYYLMPFIVYHFWLSCFFKTRYGYLPESSSIFTMCSYPRWMEWMSGNLNYDLSFEMQPAIRSWVSSRIPTYNLKSAMEELRGQLVEEVEREEKKLALESTVEPTNRDDDDARTKETTDAPKAKCRTTRRRKGNQSPQHARTRSTSSLVARLVEVKFSLFLRQTENDPILHWMIHEANWVTIVWVFGTPILSLYGILTTPFHWQTYLLGFVWYYVSGLGITAGYHRLFSHRSCTANRFVTILLALMGTTAFEGSVFDWCRDHRAHHRYTDTDLDPYNVKKGFWYAHMGWMMTKSDTPSKANISDLEADPFLQWQHKYIVPLMVGLGVGIPWVMAGLWWGEWRGGFFIAAIASRVLMQQCTFFINSLAHYAGEHTFSDQRTPRDHPLVSLVTFGEGYHNFHHEFPYDYRNGVHFYDFDPGKWLLWAFYQLGWVYTLKRFPDEVIAKGKLQMQQKKLNQHRDQLHWGPMPETLPVYTGMDQVKDECAEGAQLIVIGGYVHDVTTFLGEHPGGQAILKPYIGKDATEAFNGTVYRHSYAAWNLLDTIRIGRFANADEVQETMQRPRNLVHA